MSSNEYQKVEVILTNLVADSHLQRNLFTSDPDCRIAKLSSIMDTLNHKHGLGTIRLTGAGINGTNFRFTKCYTILK